MRLFTTAALTLALAQAPLLAQPGARLRAKQQKQQKQQDAIERFLAMSPEEQRRLLAQMTPERRRQLERTLQALESLSADERNLLRGRVQRFAAFPPARRQALRAELQYLRRLRVEDRRRRLEAPDFRQQWTAEELQFLEEVGGR